MVPSHGPASTMPRQKDIFQVDVGRGQATFVEGRDQAGGDEVGGAGQKRGVGGVGVERGVALKSGKVNL